MTNADNCAEINYEMVIDKLKEVYESWAYRAPLLSLMGRIVIVNALMESLFVYKLTVLPNIPETMCKRINSIISEFIWCGKKPKIARETLQLPKVCGGLRLFDIRNKQKTIKLSWIKKIEKNNFFKECFLLSYPAARKINCPWECNITPKDTKLLEDPDNGKPTLFWKEILNSWCEFNYHDPQNCENVKNQVIWYNSYLKRGNKLYLNRKAYESGIKKIADICNDKNDFYDYNTIITLYGNCINWLDYQGLIASIPDHWKFFLHKDNLIDTYIPRFNLIIGCAKPSSKIYTILTSEKESLIYKYWYRWEEMLEEMITREEYIKSFRKINLYSNSVKLRDFQYRLLLNKIFTNENIIRMESCR